MVRIVAAVTAVYGFRMSPTDTLVRRRMHNQKLAATKLRHPEQVVAWLGAVQAQEYAVAKWGVGQRANGITDRAVEQAVTDGRILRTHILRPTWHFVPAADIRWMLSLSAPRVHAVSAYQYRTLELDSKTLARGCRIFERALAGGLYLTRQELKVELERAGIATNGQRLAYMVMYAELEAAICSGPRRGKQSTYALVDERAPHAKGLPRDETLAELTRRYFTSHGPATIKDFVWWSGLTTADAKRGIAMVKPALVQETLADRIWWSATSRSTGDVSGSAHLLPVYDEYLIAYKDRHLVAVANATSAGAQPHDIFAHYLVIDGRLAGTWRQTLTARSIVLKPQPYHPLTKAAARAVAASAARYAQFMEKAVEVVNG